MQNDERVFCLRVRSAARISAEWPACGEEGDAMEGDGQPTFIDLRAALFVNYISDPVNLPTLNKLNYSLSVPSSLTV